MISSFLLLMLSSTSEIMYNGNNNVAENISYCIAWIVFLFCTSFLALIIWQFIKSQNANRFKSMVYFSELFIDLKSKRLARVYGVIELSRFYLFISFIIFGESISMIFKAATVTVAQVCCLTLFSWIRPFENKRYNFIKIINEIFYLIMVFLLNFFNLPSRWNGYREKSKHS